MTGPVIAGRPDRPDRPEGSAPPRVSRRVPLINLLVALVAAVAMIPLTRALESPAVVERITVVNPTPYDVRVEVADANRDGWVSVGTTRHDTTAAFESVIDQGEVWVFRFSAQGERAGELRLTRDELERNDWQLQVPEETGRLLADRGAPPPP